MADEMILQAVAALKAGDRTKARVLMVAAIKQNPDNELAWSWMFSLVDSDEQRIHCLKELLRINPNNLKARQALDKLEARYSQPPSFEEFVQEDIKPAVPYIGPAVKIPDPPATFQNVPVNPMPSPIQYIPATPAPTPVQYLPVNQVPYPGASYRNNPPGKFTAKRIITSIGMLLIILATFVTWKITNNWAGIFYPGMYRQSVTTGVDTTNGLVSAGAAVLGIILLFAINGEKKAHLFCSLCAIVSAISAISFLGEANSTGPSNNFADLYYFDFFNKPGVGIYMAIIGAAIALGCILIRSRKNQ